MAARNDKLLAGYRVDGTAVYLRVKLRDNEEVCRQCEGTGRFDDGSRCSNCDGEGVVYWEEEK